MARNKKEAKILNVKLDVFIHEQLERFCMESGLTKTMATEKILAQFFEQYFQKPENERKIFK